MKKMGAEIFILAPKAGPLVVRSVLIHNGLNNNERIGYNPKKNSSLTTAGRNINEKGGFVKSLITTVLIALFLFGCTVAYGEKVVIWKDAHKYYGQHKTIEGRIVATHNSGKACFLNFHENWKKHFTAVIFASDFASFPKNPEDYYLDKKVRVTGKIKKYKGKPEIIIKNISQIEIIK